MVTADDTPEPLTAQGILASTPTSVINTSVDGHAPKKWNVAAPAAIVSDCISDK